jgi:hypothetical protein
VRRTSGKGVFSLGQHHGPLQIILAALVFLSLTGGAQAWGDVGHKIICEVAFKLAQPRTQDQIQKLIALDSEYKTIPAYLRITHGSAQKSTT